MKSTISVIAALLLGAMFMQSCSLGTTSISDVRVCDNLDGDECSEDKQIISTAVTAIYVSAQLNDAPEGTDVTYTLRDVASGEEISDTWTTDAGGSGPFSLSWNRPGDGWVTGEYELVLDLGTANSEPITKVFEIR